MAQLGADITEEDKRDMTGAFGMSDPFINSPSSDTPTVWNRFHYRRRFCAICIIYRQMTTSPIL